MKSFLLITVLALLSVGCHHRPNGPEISWYLEPNPPVEGWCTTVNLPISNEALHVAREPVLVHSDVFNVQVKEQDLTHCIHFQMTPRGAWQLYQVTSENPGGKLVLFVNKKPIGFQVLDKPLDNGTISIFVELPNKEVTTLVKSLQKSTQYHSSTKLGI